MSEEPDADVARRRTFGQEATTCCLALGCGLVVGMFGLLLSTVLFLGAGGRLG